MSIVTDQIMKTVRIFLKKTPWGKILTFSFFVIIATILWFMQIYNQTFETNLKIPIRYTSVPDSVVFADSLPTQINVRIRDYGYTMFKYRFSKVDTVDIDIFGVINNRSTNKNIQGSTLEMYINESLTQSAEILRYEPAKINLSYSTLKSRKVPVIFDGQINLTPGHFLNGDIKLSPDSVMAYGTTADLTKLMYVYTASDTLNKLESNTEATFNLLKESNIKLSTNHVEVSIPVEAYRQMKIEVPVKCINLPENMIVKFFPSEVSVSFFIGVSMADSVSISDFSVGVDYNGIIDSKSVSVPVRITSNPSYAKSLTIYPPNVEYIFEYK